VTSALKGLFKHCSAPQNLQVCKFQPNPPEGEFCFVTLRPIFREAKSFKKSHLQLLKLDRSASLSAYTQKISPFHF
jgi:hypothetical protein